MSKYVTWTTTIFTSLVSTFTAPGTTTIPWHKSYMVTEEGRSSGVFNSTSLPRRFVLSSRRVQTERHAVSRSCGQDLLVMANACPQLNQRSGEDDLSANAKALVGLLKQDSESPGTALWLFLNPNAWFYKRDETVGKARSE